MKYWKTALSIFALSASLALAEDLRTTKGKEYKNATVSRVEPDGIVIKFKGGIVKLPFTELPSDVQKKYEYDPVAAREYAAQRGGVIPRPTATPDANLRTSEADDAQTSARELNPAEQWVIAQATAGEIADLSKQFPNEEDRQLSADFLEALLMGIRPDVRLHRHGVQIKGACIDEPIDLENAKIPCEVLLEHFQFNASVTFEGANFAANASFQDSTFNAEAKFNRVKVGGDASFSDALFEGPVRFGTADIASDFQAEQAKFQQNVDFWGMKVGGDANIADAVFDGAAQFSRVTVASDFEALGTKFQNKESGADFFGMKVGGNAVLTAAVFEGPARFDAADIAGSMKAGAKFQHGASFERMKVQGSASFYNATFEDVANFRYADFGSLFLSRVSWPKHTPQCELQGMSYKYFQAAATEPESHNALLKLAGQSSYTADVYSGLEEFFKRQGYRGDADKAFVAGKRREREEYFHNRHWLGWLGSWMLNLLVGYGRRPWQAAIPCAILIALGCVLFSPTKMEPRNLGEAPRVYSRFWYSLGLFLPFVDLQADKVWKPKADQTFLRNYMRVHIMLGWILVPLVLAALTGLIK